MQHNEWAQGESGPVIYLAAGDLQEAAAVFDLLCRETPLPFRLAAFAATDWNRELSPWPAPPVFGKEGFAGQADATLRWLREEYLPLVEKSPAPARLIGGYSLGGLFSLWAFYESGLFRGAAGCSASLWFPGWQDYVQQKSAPQGGLYLSLGKREPFTRNQAMQSIGAVMEWQREYALRQGLRATLVWHEGGHFQEPERRIALGLKWLLEACCSI